MTPHGALNPQKQPMLHFILIFGCLVGLLAPVQAQSFGPSAFATQKPAKRYAPLLLSKDAKPPVPFIQATTSPEAYQRFESALEELEDIHTVLMPDDAYLMKIQILFQLNRLREVEETAHSFLRRYTQSPHVPLVYYFHNKSRYLLNLPLKLNHLHQRELRAKLPPAYQSDFFRILSHDAKNRGHYLASVNWLIQEFQGNKTLAQTTKQEIIEAMKHIEDMNDLTSLQKKYQDLDFVQNEVPYLYLQILFEKQHYPAAQQLLEKLLEEAKDENLPQLPMLLALEERLKLASKLKPFRIGVILPLSTTHSKIARLAQEVLQGLRLAVLAQEQFHQSLQHMNPSEAQIPSIQKANTPTHSAPPWKQRKQASNSPSATVENVPQALSQLSNSIISTPMPPIELVIRDSHLDPEKTLEAVNQLIEEEHVIAIVGPLIRKTSEAAAKEAQRRQVPLISLSLTSSIPLIGDYVFRNNQTWIQEIQALVQYSILQRGFKRFLVLYPNTREGQFKMSLFWDEVENLGGHIVGVEDYKPNDTSFVSQFESFTGLDRPMLDLDPEPSIDYKYEKGKYIEEEIPEKPEGIQDFDAIYIPASTGKVNDLKVIFPYPKVYEMNRVVLLGDSAWNQQSLLLELSNLRREKIFVGSFFKDSPLPHVQYFVKLYEKYFYNSQAFKDISAYTAYAYDTTNILIQLLQDWRHHNHQALQGALLKMKPYDGITGSMHFDEQGNIVRSLKLLTVKRGKVVQIKNETAAALTNESL